MPIFESDMRTDAYALKVIDCFFPLLLILPFSSSYSSSFSSSSSSSPPSSFFAVVSFSWENNLQYFRSESSNQLLMWEMECGRNISHSFKGNKFWKCSTKKKIATRAITPVFKVSSPCSSKHGKNSVCKFFQVSSIWLPIIQILCRFSSPKEPLSFPKHTHLGQTYRLTWWTFRDTDRVSLKFWLHNKKRIWGYLAIV